jgi:hypothetical protein
MKKLEIFSKASKLVEPMDFESYWYLPGNFTKDLETDTLISIISTIDYMYRRKEGYQNNNRFRELIKNARVHGGAIEGKETFCGLFMNKEKFCFGINDGGDYFKRLDIKDIWENRKDLKEFHETNDPSTGFHIGYSMIRDWKGDIFVDTNFGTFYLIKNFEQR